MNRYPFTEKELKKAVIDYTEHWSHEFSAALDGTSAVLSPAFTERMDCVFTERKEEIRRKRRLRIPAAMLALVLLAGIIAFFAIDTPARAAFLRFTRSVCENGIEYIFHGKGSEQQLPDISPRGLPEGMELTHEEADETYVLRVYSDKDVKNGLIVDYGYVSESTALYIDPMGQSIHVQDETYRDHTISCYLSEIAGENDNYIWFNRAETVYFTVQSNLPAETVLPLVRDMIDQLGE